MPTLTTRLFLYFIDKGDKAKRQKRQNSKILPGVKIAKSDLPGRI